MESTSLFVYGSFVPGHEHFNRIEQYVESHVSATVNGGVFRLEVGYPVFSAQYSTPIAGACLKLVESSLVWKIMDEFHGFNRQSPEKSLFHRLSVQASLSNGDAQDAFVYAINPHKLPKTARLIEDGNWGRSLTESAPITRDLTENQIRYISRLGASTGRDIVPINLELYRELMNKGLIVDKGRRLALTPLGKEVYRYLPSDEQS